MYVGRTKNAELRLRQHLDVARGGDRTVKSEWLRQLQEVGLAPSIKILDTCLIDEWQDREKHWIDHHRSINPELKTLTQAAVVIAAKTKRKFP